MYCVDETVGENMSSSSSEEEEEVVNGENEEDMDNKGGTISEFIKNKSSYLH